MIGMLSIALRFGCSGGLTLIGVATGILSYSLNLWVDSSMRPVSRWTSEDELKMSGMLSWANKDLAGGSRRLDWPDE